MYSCVLHVLASATSGFSNRIQKVQSPAQSWASVFFIYSPNFFFHLNEIAYVPPPPPPPVSTIPYSGRGQRTWVIESSYSGSNSGGGGGWGDMMSVSYSVYPNLQTVVHCFLVSIFELA